MDEDKFDELLKEYLKGMDRCNVNPAITKRNKAVIKDFYYTKLQDYFKEEKKDEARKV